MSSLTATPSKVPFVKALMGAATLALLGVLAVGVSGASAQGGAFVGDGDDDAYGTAVCIVKGAAGTATSPVDGPAHDANDDDEAWDPANLMDTDGGNFLFSTTAPDSAVVCAGTDIGGEVIGPLASADFEIVAGTLSRLGEGEYTNLVLPTGHAEGSADLCGPAWVVPGPPFDTCTAAAPGAGLNQTNLVTRFSIPFIIGQGPLNITSFDGVVDLTAPVAPTGMEDCDNTPFPPGCPPPVDNLQDIDTGHGFGVVSIIEDPASMPAREDGTDPGVLVPGNPDCNRDPAPGPAGPPGYTPGAPVGPDGDPGTPAIAPADNVTGFIVGAAFTATLSGDTDYGNNENDDAPDANAVCDA